MQLIIRSRSIYLLLLAAVLLLLGSVATAQEVIVIPASSPEDSASSLRRIAGDGSFNSPVQLTWFYKPPEDGTSLSHLSNNFSYFVLTKNDESQRNYLQNRGHPVLQYTKLDAIHDPCFQARDPVGTTCNCNRNPLNNQVAWNANDICFIRDNHRSWFLRDKNGQLIYSSQGNRDFIIMDPGNQGWRDFWLSRMRQSQSTGWDGIFIDNMATTFTRHGGNPVDLRDYSRQGWRNAIAGFLRYARQDYFSGANKKMLANLSVYWNEEPTYFQYLQYLDGTMDEHWGVLGNDTGVYSALSWERRILRADATLAQGKNMLLVSRGARNDHHRRNFALASYLLVDRGNGYFRYSRQGDYDAAWLYDDYDISLGAPVGNYYRQGSNWVRDFENGKVSVNPGAYTYEFLLDVAPPQAFQGFTLIDARSDNDIKQLTNGTTLSESEARNINVRADMAGGDPGAITFTLNGPTNITRREGSAPYALFGNNGNDYAGRSLSPGTYSLSATASNAPGNPLVVSFSVGGSQSNQAPRVSITSNKSASQTSNSSVTFTLNASANDPDGTIESYTWSNGDRDDSTSVTVSPGASRTLSVYVTDNNGTNSNTASITLTVSSSTASGPRITSLTLIDAGRDVVLRELQSGGSLTWNEAQSFNVRANIAGGDPGRVEFRLRGRVNYNRTEGQAVYALFGNTGNDYYKGSLPVGEYALEVIPSNNSSGALTVNFSVVSSSNRDVADEYSGMNWQLPQVAPLDADADYYNLVFTDDGYNILADEWYPADHICLQAACEHVLERKNLPTGLTNGTYSWWVRSWSSEADMSEWSSEGAFIISLPAPTLMPLTMTMNNGRFELAWLEDDGIEWLHIYIGTSAGSEVYRQWIPSTQSTCSESVCRFTPDVTPLAGSYVVYFQAWGLGGFAGGSLESWNGPTSINVNVPFLPRNLQVDTLSHKLTWEASSGASEYEIWVGTITPQDTTAYMRVHSAADLGCVVTNVCSIDLSGDVSSGHYVWYVRALNSAGASQGGLDGWAEGPSIDW